MSKKAAQITCLVIAAIMIITFVVGAISSAFI